MIGESGESIPMELFGGTASGKAFRIIEGDSLKQDDTASVKQLSSAKKVEDGRESYFSYADELDDDQRSRRSLK